MFRALGQTTRLKIIFLLAEQELCVCELEDILKISQPAVSQHLRVLKDAELVEEERRGQWSFYSLNREMLKKQFAEFLTVIERGLATSGNLPEELQKLKELQQNPKVGCRVPQQSSEVREGR